jgi:hypothetical protein
MTGAEPAAEHQEIPDTYDIMMPAFERAYPGRDAAALEHSVRNFSQVVSGIVDLAARRGLDSGEEVTLPEFASSMVAWCVANSRLEDYFEDGDGHAARSGPIPADEVEGLMSEIVARAADWLIGIEALKSERVLYSAFVKGSAALSADRADPSD